MQIREFVFGNRELQGPRSGNLCFADARAGGFAQPERRAQGPKPVFAERLRAS